jgi:hypothetical protein
MLVFFLIIGGLIYLATVYIKQKHGTFDAFIDEAKKQLSGDEDEDEESGFMEDQDFPPDSTNRIAPSPEEPDTETVPPPTQEQLSKWRELEEMCKPTGIRSMYTGFKVDEETGDFVPEYDNIDCCFEQPWKNEGDCVDGQQKQIRGILNEDLCDVEPEKEQMVDCCSYGEWENDGECVDGVQKQNRQIFNPDLCVDTTTTREIDCCSYGEWEFDGECVDGNQNYTRTIINSELCEDKSLMKTEKCCLPLEWANDGFCKPTGMQMQQRAHLNRDLCTEDDYEDVREVPCCYRDDWKDDGLCNFSEGKLQQRRTIENANICREEGDAATTQTIDCCYIGPWENDGPGDEESGVQKQGRTLKNEETCPLGTEATREVPGCKRAPWSADPNWNYGRGCNSEGEIGMQRSITLMDKCENPDPTSEENLTSKIDNCCFKEDWLLEGECVDGKQKLTRNIVNKESCDDNDGDVDGIITEKIVDCCGFSDWEVDKNAYGVDETQNYCTPRGKRTETRELFNRNLCDRDGKSFLLTQPTSQEIDCCYIASPEILDDDASYAIDYMTYMNFWKKYMDGDNVDSTITTEDWDKHKEENITPCTPSGELRMKRIVANPELCKAEAAAGTREDDPHSFKSEYGEKCCSLHAGEEPKNGTYCDWGDSFTGVSSNGIGLIDMKLESKNDDVCMQDVGVMVKFQTGKFEYKSSRRAQADRYVAWTAAINDGTAYWSDGYWGKSRDDDSISVKRTCYSNGTIEGSDINWGKYVDPDPEVSTNGKCGADAGGRRKPKRCPNDQCCSEYDWCGGKIGTKSDFCSAQIGGKGWGGGKYKGHYDGIHYNMPKDTDWSITK